MGLGLLVAAEPIARLPSLQGLVPSGYFAQAALLAGGALLLPRLLQALYWAWSRYTSFGDHEWSYRHVPEGTSPSVWNLVGRYGVSLGGLDLELVFGSAFDRLGSARLPDARELERYEAVLEVFHGRYAFGALNGVWAVSDWLVRFELGADLRRPISLRRWGSAFLDLTSERHDQVNGLIGLTFFGLPSTNLALELQRSVLIRSPGGSDEAEPLWPIEAPMLAFRWTQNMLDDALVLNVIAVAAGVDPFQGALIRLDLSWKLQDGLIASAGYVHFESTEHFGPFHGFERNDRAQLGLRWDFGLL